jgi:hypothetical protein
MLIDASVARSFAVTGWSRQLVAVTGGTIYLADGVHGQHADDPSELRNIRCALQRRADQADSGSGLASRALAAVHGLDEMLTLPPAELAVLSLDDDELELAVRLQSRQAEDRAWRHSLGAKARRLDAGESASIAIASCRSLRFASDDEDALILWRALTGTQAYRTLNLLWQLVDDSGVGEVDAREIHRQLQADDLHSLGGPPWETGRPTYEKSSPASK